jgi:hypothetical protein
MTDLPREGRQLDDMDERRQHGAVLAGGRADRDTWLWYIPGSRLQGYKGRNPRTGTSVEVAPKRLPFFKVSKNFAADVNGGRAQKLEAVRDQYFRAATAQE